MLERAGVPFDNRIVMQFIDDDLNQTLHTLEFENTERAPEEWLKTIFELRKKGSGWEFFIVEQHFRDAPP